MSGGGFHWSLHGILHRPLERDYRAPPLTPDECREIVDGFPRDDRNRLSMPICSISHAPEIEGRIHEVSEMVSRFKRDHYACSSITGMAYPRREVVSFTVRYSPGRWEAMNQNDRRFSLRMCVESMLLVDEIRRTILA